MLRFEVHLTEHRGGYWVARLTDGTLILPLTKQPRVEVAGALLARGADPRSEFTIWHGEQIIASDTLGRATGRPETCDDESQMIQPDRIPA